MHLWILRLSKSALAAVVLGSVVLGGCGSGGGPRPNTQLEVRSTPPGAAIFVAEVRGNTVGPETNTGQKTPAVVTFPVEAGGSQLKVTVRLAGYEDASTVVTARPDEVVPVEFTLKASQPPAIPPHTITGQVRVVQGGTSAPAANPTVTATETTTGEVFRATLDSERPGVYYIFAPPGTYRVTAWQAGFQESSREVTIVSGEDRQTGVDFLLSPGS